MVHIHALALEIYALFTWISSLIFTSSIIKYKYTNSIPTISFTNLEVLSLEKKTVIQRLQDCIYFFTDFPSCWVPFSLKAI